MYFESETTLCQKPGCSPGVGYHARPLGLTMSANAPRLPRRGMGTAGIALFTDNTFHCITMKLDTNARQFRAKMTKQPEIALCPLCIAS